MNNNIKSELQQREFDSVKDSHRVILKWATGVGKSKMTIDMVNNVIAQHGTRLDVVFVVAERAHIKNWQQEFDKWHLNKDNISLHLLCYASLHKLKNMSFDILVLDEGHHCFTDKRKEILSTIKADYIYMLSATLSRQKTEEIEDLFGKFTISSVTLKDAIGSNILPDPRVYVIGMDLDDTEANQEIAIGTGNKLPKVKWQDRNNYIFKKIPCILQCTQKQKYTYLTNTMEYWKNRYQRSHNEFHHNKWVNLGSTRKRFLGENKTKQVRELINALSGKKRYICFCASVAQCNELGSKTAINSKRKDNQQVIDKFNEGKTDTLFAVGMATEGMNLNNIQAGIIVQLDGKERLFIQKFGRSLRAEDPIAYIFYYKDTQDEVYLKNALENIDEKFVRYIDNVKLLKTIKL